MSTTNHITQLEARVWENNQKFEILSTHNHKLTTENSKQEHLIAKYEEDFNLPEPHLHTPPSLPASLEMDIRSVLEHLPGRPFPQPGPIPTPFYITSREACQFHLAFVIPGFHGETLEVAVNNVDLAFVLQQTLKRRGWGNVMTTRGVEDFLERPLVKVKWVGGEGEVGVLVEVLEEGGAVEGSRA